VAAVAGTFYGQTMHKGDIYTIAGGGSSNPADGIPATSAFISPNGVALDAAGNVLIADSGQHRIRVIAETTGTFYGQAMTAGDIYTVAGGGSAVPGNGGPATKAEIYSPDGVAVDSHGNLILTDGGFPAATNPSDRVVATVTGTFYGQAMTGGDIYTVAGGNPPGFSGDGGPATSAELNGPGAVAVDGAGNLLIADSANNRIREVAG
jgi:secreted PhoX family phosphatase